MTGVDAGGGQSTVWFASSIPIQFDFAEPAAPPLNRAWLEALNRQAATSGGLTLIDEPAESETETP